MNDIRDELTKGRGKAEARHEAQFEQIKARHERNDAAHAFVGRHSRWTGQTGRRAHLDDCLLSGSG